MPSFKFMSLFFVGLMLAGPVSAAEINDAGAAALQTKFTQELASRSNIKIAGSKADFTGDVTVTPKGSYYEVLMPSVKLTDKNGNVLNVGKLVMNMIPSNDNAADFKSSLAIPSSMTYVDKTGKEAAKVSVGSQKASGIWNMDMFGFRKFDSSYNDINVVGTTSGDQIALGNLITNYELTKSEAGYSGPVTVVANDLFYTDKAGTKSSLAKQAKVTSQIKADKEAQGGYTQTSQATITGMDSAVALINAKMKDPAVQNKAQLQKAFGALTILQMSGKPGGSADTRSYDVVTTPQGKTLLNGVDVSLLLGAISIK